MTFDAGQAVECEPNQGTSVFAAADLFHLNEPTRPFSTDAAKPILASSTRQEFFLMREGRPAPTHPLQQVLVAGRRADTVWAYVQHGRLCSQTLLDGMRIRAFTEDGTTSPKCVILVIPELKPALTDPVEVRTEAARLIEDGMSLANLTQEEFAPLLGVTRRSLSNWKAGEAISARKELRLRGLVEALCALSKGDADLTRARLYNRLPGGLRPYDILAEGRFDVAVQLATGRPSPADVKPIALPAVPKPAPVLARLSLREDVATEPHGRVDLRRSRRLKR